VIPESRELSPAEAEAKHRGAGEDGAFSEVIVADRLPGHSAWQDPVAWFRALQTLLPELARDTLGIREHAPGVFVHVRARISANAELRGPCWVGAHASIEAGARVGPGTVIEDGAYVDEGAEVVESFVGPGTYVGALTELRESLAWGRALFNFRTGSFTEVSDEFLLGEIHDRASRRRKTPLPGRCAALAALVLLSPVVLVAWLRRAGKASLFTLHQGVRAPVSQHSDDLLETLVYRELEGVSGLWKRWPQLWNVVRGDFAWVGNRPLTRQQALELTSDFERLWLAVPPGLISLADAEECAEPWSDEGRAHASFYAAHAGFKTDWAILRRVLRRSAASARAPALAQTLS
jgi:hypothetical protein